MSENHGEVRLPTLQEQELGRAKEAQVVQSQAQSRLRMEVVAPPCRP